MPFSAATAARWVRGILIWVRFSGPHAPEGKTMTLVCVSVASCARYAGGNEKSERQ